MLQYDNVKPIYRCTEKLNAATTEKQIKKKETNIKINEKQLTYLKPKSEIRYIFEMYSI